MQQSPSWEANGSSASQHILCILWKPNVHYRIHKSPPHVRIVCQINSVNAPPSHCLQSHFTQYLLQHQKWTMDTSGVANACQVRQVKDTDLCDSDSHSQELSIF
jgi:hypothetical protein